jgi:hypothetical protein
VADHHRGSGADSAAPGRQARGACPSIERLTEVDRFDRFNEQLCGGWRNVVFFGISSQLVIIIISSSSSSSNSSSINNLDETICCSSSPTALLEAE